MVAFSWSLLLRLLLLLLCVLVHFRYGHWGYVESQQASKGVLPVTMGTPGDKRGTSV